MSDSATIPEVAYHVVLHSDEVPVATTAISLLISDEVHQPQIRRLGREVLSAPEAGPKESGKLKVALEPKQMKIMYSAVRLLFDDLQREQPGQRDILRSILNKLPDQHTTSAIELDTQALQAAVPDPVVDDQAA